MSRALMMLLGLYAGGAYADPAAMDEYALFDYAPDLMRIVPAARPTFCEIESGAGFVWNAGERTEVRCKDFRVSLVGLPPKGESDGETATVRLELKSPHAGDRHLEMKVDEFPSGFLDEVWSSDLNGDGRPDVLLRMGSHGNGLAAEIGGLIFLLSDGKRYHYVSLDDVMPGREIRLFSSPDGHGEVLLLQRMAGQGQRLRGDDGRRHVFFVFDLLGFGSDGLSLMNRLDARFPFWTQMTSKPTRTETRLLDEKRKRMLWRDPVKAARKHVMS